jgi:hypothetical protein
MDTIKLVSVYSEVCKARYDQSMTDNILNALVEKVQAYYERNTEPLLLSRFGQTNSELRERAIKEHGSLAKAVRASEARLQILVPKTGHEIVVPAEKKEEIETALLEGSATAKSAAHQLVNVPKPVQLAFCVKTSPGERVAVSGAAPWRYVKVPEGVNLDPGFILVPDRFRHPGLFLKTASDGQKEQVWRSYLAWREDNSIEFDKDVVAAKESASALARFLAAQDASILPRIVIPADIVEILLRQK